MADPHLPFGFALPPLPNPGGDELDIGAIMRREQFIRQFGVDPNAPDFGAQTMGNFAQQAVPQIAFGALPVAGNMFGRLAQAAPKTATGLAAAVGSLLTPSQAGSQPSETVKQLQIKLRDAGYYRGPIDGNMGPITQEAKAAFDKAELEQQRLKTEQERIAGETAATNLAKEAGERKAQERAAGEKRLREMETNISPFSRAVRDYSGPVGLAAGLATGLFTRGKVVGSSNRASQATADRANKLMSDTPSADLAERTARVNRFWSEGQRTMPFGAPAVEPFSSAPRTRYGFRANSDVPPAASLYQPDRVRNIGTDLGVTALGGVEAGITHELANSWRQELATAQNAVGDDPSEANIQRLQHALNQVALYEGASRMGLGLSSGYLGGAVKMRRANTRPDVDVADAERLRINQLLSSRAKPLPKKR